MASLAGMVLDDPESFHLLTADMKLKIIDAAINKVNIQAAMTRKKAIENIQKNFTLRNAWTAKQIQYTQMPRGRYALSAIQATVGATETGAYMERQEMGGKHEPLGGQKNLAIPTLRARGGNLGVMVKKPYRTSNLAKLKVQGAFTRAQDDTKQSRQVARAAVAFREGKLIRYGENLFFVDSFVARGGQVSFTKKMLYHMNKPFTTTQPSPWLLPAAEAAALEGERIFAREMKKAGL
jgi:uncharacterized protein (DUF2141 family)